MERLMKKLMIYAHDDAGFSSLERVLSISTDLLDSDPDLSILLVSGSPMMPSFRIPSRLDYIKLPTLNRSKENDLFLHDPFQDLSIKEKEMSRFRSSLLLTAVKSFSPDLLLVDKMPNGVRNELGGVLNHLKIYMPETRLILLMGDPIDTTETCLKTWETVRHHQAVELFYDLVLFSGTPDVVCASRKGAVPSLVAEKIRLCLDRHALEKMGQLILAEFPEGQNMPVTTCPDRGPSTPALTASHT